MAVGILDMWREARGAVLRKEYEDVITRMRNANPSARTAFLNKIHQTIDHVIGFYLAASVSGRKGFLKKMRKESLKLWKSGDWPSALGLGIACLNAQSRVVPGEDAAYVKLETDRIIKEASAGQMMLVGSGEPRFAVLAAIRGLRGADDHRHSERGQDR